MSSKPTVFVAYLRVSTAKQGAKGLGIEAQRAAVEAFASQGAASIAAEYVEVETGKGHDALERRPQLAAAPPTPPPQGAGRRGGSAASGGRSLHLGTHGKPGALRRDGAGRRYRPLHAAHLRQCCREGT